MEKREPSYTVGGNANSTAAMENSVEIPLKLVIELPYDPAIRLLGIHTEETRIERDTCVSHVHHSIIYNCQDMEAT